MRKKGMNKKSQISKPFNFKLLLMILIIIAIAGILYLMIGRIANAVFPK